MTDDLQNIKINSIYFTELELLGQHTGQIPIISDTSNFQELMNAVAHSKYRCCLVIDETGLFLNIFTQGDVLRYSERFQENGLSLSHILANKKKAVVAVNSAQAVELIKNHEVSVIPLVDLENRLIGASVTGGQSTAHYDAPEIPRIGLVMSGGKGSRLYPLTEDTPKPLLSLGRQSILEHVLDSLGYAGVQRCVLMAGHLSDKFFEFQEKSQRQFSIFVEDSPLGTGGPLLKWFKDDRPEIDAYLEKYGSFTLLVCNGDLIFDLSRQMISDFEASGDQITLIARNHRHAVKFGVLSADKDSYLKEFKEKPVYEFLVNTGIYLFNIDNSFLETFDTLEITNIDMPDLLVKLEKEFGIKVRVREIVGNYIDLGTKEDLIEISTFFRE